MNLLFQSVRYEPKGFFLRKPDGKGGWVDKGIFENGTRPVPYRLPRVAEAVREGSTIFVVEGEKDVHRLEREGLVATTNPMGAGKWRDDHSLALVGADVRIIPDNDNAGREHARKVAESLRGRAQSVRVIELPGLPDGGDVCDFFEEGGTAEQLQSMPSSPSPSYMDSDGDDGGTRPVEGLRLTSFASVPRPPDKRPMVIEQVIPQGFPAMFYGEGGSAKSLLAASAALDVARGAEEWMGFGIRRHGPTVLLDFELDLQEQARRVYQLAEGVGLDKPPDDFYYLSGADHEPGKVLDHALQQSKRIRGGAGGARLAGVRPRGRHGSIPRRAPVHPRSRAPVQGRRHHAPDSGPSGEAAGRAKGITRSRPSAPSTSPTPAAR